MTDSLSIYVQRLGDNALVLGQRMVELVTREPELEEELANANFALDYIGQARMFYQYAAELDGEGNDEDFYAYRRDAQAFMNYLLLEQPNGHFGDAIVRQYLFEVFYLMQLEGLAACNDQRLAEIAARAEKEIRYHLRHSRSWMLRLGDGTEESHQKMQRALEQAWRYCGEFFYSDAADRGVCKTLGLDLPEDLQSRWNEEVNELLSEATLERPGTPWIREGGRHGKHSEHLGYLVAELQHLQRSYPDASW
ncbi:MAG: phenylacetate-CoA oxygenase subunit PaaC [Woeseiaceae bacterium]|nr:phenylacetate-CoA oxygenase subunit PaaC [Woeseiaceae bacterium]